MNVNFILGFLRNETVLSVLLVQALIYDVLEYTAKRNQCAKDFKGKHEADAAKCPVKLFI